MATHREEQDPIVFPDESAEGLLPPFVPGWSVLPAPRAMPATALPLVAGALFAGLGVGMALRGGYSRGRLALAAGVGLAGFGLLAGRGLWFATRYEIPELNRAPEELPPVQAGEHGTVHRGRTEVPREGGGSRPYLWIWLVPAPGNPCERRGSYRWYQYVRLRLTLDGERKRVRGSILGATGLKYRFDEWNPDYHASEVGPADPTLSPPGLGLDADRAGKPFRHYDVPGTRTAGGTSTLTGVLDAPNFCQRGTQAHSPAEQLLERFLPAGGTVREQIDRPADQTVRMRIEIEGRSYLVCVADGAAACIGRVEWDYANDIEIRLTWSVEGVTLGAQKRWRLGSEIRRCDLSLDIGDWVQPC